MLPRMVPVGHLQIYLVPRRSIISFDSISASLVAEDILELAVFHAEVFGFFGVFDGDTVGFDFESSVRSGTTAG